MVSTLCIIIKAHTASMIMTPSHNMQYTTCHLAISFSGKGIWRYCPTPHSPPHPYCYRQFSISLSFWLDFISGLTRMTTSQVGSRKCAADCTIISIALKGKTNNVILALPTVFTHTRLWSQSCKALLLVNW